VKEGDKAPFTGFLMPDYQFDRASLATLELGLCEESLKNKDCSDSVETDFERIKSGAGWFFIGLATGAVLISLIRR